MAKRLKQKLTGNELLSRLEETVSTGSIFVGIVKSSDEDGHFEYAHPSRFGTWAKIPVSQVLSIEPVGHVVAGGRRHELVRMAMRPPTTPEAATLGRLADLHHDVVLHLTNGALVSGFKSCPVDQIQCWNDATQKWDCCPA